MSDVSVIVPIYNSEKSLNKCIDSILHQTYKNIEIILVNDGSTDNSKKICENYVHKDKRINLINKKNEGCAKARKTGISVAKSKYIIFVDSDDYIHKCMIEKLYEDIENNKSDISICKKEKFFSILPFIKTDINGNLKKYLQKQKNYESIELKNEILKSFLFSGCFPCEMFAKIYKRELFNDMGKYSDSIKFFGEDLYLNIEIFLNAKKISILDEVLYYYRYGGGTSRYMPDYFEDIVNGYAIKKRVINDFYNSESQELITEVNKNFLELLQSCLLNLMYSNYDKEKIKAIIETYINDSNIMEVIKGLQDNGYNSNFIQMLNDKDVEFVFEYFVRQKEKRKNKDRVLRLLTGI